MPMTMTLLLLLTAPSGVGHKPICSVSMPSAIVLASQLNSASAMRRWPKANGVTTYFDDGRTTLWWVVDRHQAAFPATVCKRLGGPVRTRCGGSVKACKVLTSDMAKAKL